MVSASFFTATFFAAIGFVYAAPALLGVNGGRYIGTDEIHLQDTFQDVISAHNIGVHDNLQDPKVLAK